MLDYINQKQDLLEAILENTKAQSKAIQQDQTVPLEGLINDREGLMKQVDALDQEAAQAKITLSEDLTNSIRQKLKEIITIDNANQALIKQELDGSKQKLKDIRIGRQQGVNYGPEYGLHVEEGILFDTKSSN